MVHKHIGEGGGKKSESLMPRTPPTISFRKKILFSKKVNSKVKGELCH